MTDINISARGEAYRRYNGDTIISEITGEPESHDDYGYAETARQAFVAGAEWAERREGMVEALVWMMDQPRLTSGGNTGMILSGFVRSCAKAHGIDLEKAVMDRVGQGPAGSR